MSRTDSDINIRSSQNPQISFIYCARLGTIHLKTETVQFPKRCVLSKRQDDG
jgi:hypothetical protein